MFTWLGFFPTSHFISQNLQFTRRIKRSTSFKKRPGLDMAANYFVVPHAEHGHLQFKVNQNPDFQSYTDTKM